MVKIPLAAYKSNNPLMDLTKIKDILVVRSVDPPGGDDVTLNNFSLTLIKFICRNKRTLHQ
jgi:hypothetical protein